MLTDAVEARAGPRFEETSESRIAKLDCLADRRRLPDRGRLDEAQ